MRGWVGGWGGEGRRERVEGRVNPTRQEGKGARPHRLIKKRNITQHFKFLFSEFGLFGQSPPRLFSANVETRHLLED